jgi:glycosyltransferase involved in cell wall biosynthesis
MNSSASSLPLVTIVAISYNQEKYVIDALSSIKNQTYPNIQLIIADDASSDNTKKLIQKWVAEKWPSAIFIDHAINLGVTKNLNSALPYINGNYYQFIGCEDNMIFDKIEKQVGILEKNPQYSIVYSDMYQMDAPGKLSQKTYYQSRMYDIPKTDSVYEGLLERCFISTPSALMRTRVLFDIGGDNELLDINDYDFWLRASKKYVFFYHPDVTMEYRVLPTSLSNQKGVKIFLSRFLMFYQNYNRKQPYKMMFDRKLLFNAKNLYSLKYRNCFFLFIKAFFKTGNLEYLKYAFAAILFIRLLGNITITNS